MYIFLLIMSYTLEDFPETPFAPLIDGIRYISSSMKSLLTKVDNISEARQTNDSILSGVHKILNNFSVKEDSYKKEIDRKTKEIKDYKMIINQLHKDIFNLKTFIKETEEFSDAQTRRHNRELNKINRLRSERNSIYSKYDTLIYKYNKLYVNFQNLTMENNVEKEENVDTTTIYDYEKCIDNEERDIEVIELDCDEDDSENLEVNSEDNLEENLEVNTDEEIDMNLIHNKNAMIAYMNGASSKTTFAIQNSKLSELAFENNESPEIIYALSKNPQAADAYSRGLSKRTVESLAISNIACRAYLDNQTESIIQAIAYSEIAAKAYLEKRSLDVVEAISYSNLSKQAYMEGKSDEEILKKTESLCSSFIKPVLETEEEQVIEQVIEPVIEPEEKPKLRRSARLAKKNI